MSLEKQIKAIQKWQSEGKYHPLTCGKDSTHELLEPRVIEGKVCLVCPTCKLIQTFVPGVVLGANT